MKYCRNNLNLKKKMGRLNIDRQKELEPQRIAYAKEQITKLGYDIEIETSTYLQFTFKGKPVKLYPYSGWHTGATIQDGRGIEKLLKQIKS